MMGMKWIICPICGNKTCDRIRGMIYNYPRGAFIYFNGVISEYVWWARRRLFIL